MSWTTECEVISIGSKNALALRDRNCAPKVQLLLEPVETKRKTNHSSGQRDWRVMVCRKACEACCSSHSGADGVHLEKTGHGGYKGLITVYSGETAWAGVGLQMSVCQLALLCLSVAAW